MEQRVGSPFRCVPVLIFVELAQQATSGRCRGGSHKIAPTSLPALVLGLMGLGDQLHQAASNRHQSMSMMQHALVRQCGVYVQDLLGARYSLFQFESQMI